jgi:CDP-diacylglycerol---serine O-phosphatidyltransferase
MEKHLPNFLTILNLFSGFLGIIAAFNGELVFAAWLVFIGAMFDFFDGMAARWLKAYSPIGMDLDSLADMVTFGVLPAIIVHFLLLKSQANIVYSLMAGPVPVISLLPFALTAFAAIRLAKFNIDPLQRTYFLGLPTPANAIFFASFPLILQYNLLIVYYTTSDLTKIFLNAWLLLFLVILFSWLMISPIPIFSFKLSLLRWREYPHVVGFLAISVILFALFLFAAIPVIVLLYIIISFLFRNKTVAGVKTEDSSVLS